MSREEALKILKYRSGWNLSIRDVNALEMAIKALEQQPCEDKIIEWKKDFKEYVNSLSIPRDDYKGIMEYIDELPVTSQQPCYNPDEWCHDCSEYNHDKHCCSRYNKVIRSAVEEIKQPKAHWISYWDEEARCYVYKCPECGNKQPFDTKHCWECGARLDVSDINDGKLSEISTGSESEET